MRIFVLSLALMFSSPAAADIGDELQSVPAGPLIGKAYPGAGMAAEIEFINVRRQPVRLNWIDRDGSLQFYALIPPGGELLQPTFVSHRWVIMRYQTYTSSSGAIVVQDRPAASAGALIEAFIATRSDMHGDGQPQIAIIR